MAFFISYPMDYFQESTEIVFQNDPQDKKTLTVMQYDRNGNLEVIEVSAEDTFDKPIEEE